MPEEIKETTEPVKEITKEQPQKVQLPKGDIIGRRKEIFDLNIIDKKTLIICLVLFPFGNRFFPFFDFLTEFSPSSFILFIYFSIALFASSTCNAEEI